MGTSDALSGLALLVSIVAAVIAHFSRKAADRSADSAERANDINLHQSRLEIFKAFQAFHGALVQHGTTLREEHIWPFLNKANLSEFYFDHSLYERTVGIVTAALSAVAKAEEFEFARQVPDGLSRAESTNMRAIVSEKFKRLRAECADVDIALRAELRLHRPS